MNILAHDSVFGLLLIQPQRQNTH